MLVERRVVPKRRRTSTLDIQRDGGVRACRQQGRGAQRPERGRELHVAGLLVCVQGPEGRPKHSSAGLGGDSTLDVGRGRRCATVTRSLCGMRQRSHDWRRTGSVRWSGRGQMLTCDVPCSLKRATGRAGALGNGRGAATRCLAGESRRREVLRLPGLWGSGVLWGGLVDELRRPSRMAGLMRSAAVQGAKPRGSSESATVQDRQLCERSHSPRVQGSSAARRYKCYFQYWLVCLQQCRQMCW